MTKLKSTIAALIIVMGAGFANAEGFEDEAAVRVLKGKEGVYNLLFESKNTETVDVRILDSRDRVLSTKKIKKTQGFMQPINFNGVATGEYSIEVSNGDEEIILSVEHTR